jgi:hypothetical protein
LQTDLLQQFTSAQATLVRRKVIFQLPRQCPGAVIGKLIDKADRTYEADGTTTTSKPEAMREFP